jgi:hypothetical protein
MEQSQPQSRRPSNSAVAEENELSVLKLAHEYGHVRRTEVARAIWPESSTGMSEKMTQRTVRRLLGRSQLSEIANTLGGLSLILAKRGAARLREWGVDARQGCDMSSVTGPQFYHRMLGTCYLIERQVRGHTSFGEHAMATGQAPVSMRELERRFKKVPDGLVLLPEAERGYAGRGQIADWVEVESSRKPYQELRRILDVAWQSGVFLDDAQTIMLDRVVFVYNERQGHEESITKAVEKYILASRPDSPSVFLSGISLARCKIRTPLVWCGHEEIDGNTLLSEVELPARHPQ